VGANLEGADLIRTILDKTTIKKTNSEEIVKTIGVGKRIVIEDFEEVRIQGNKLIVVLKQQP